MEAATGSSINSTDAKPAICPACWVARRRASSKTNGTETTTF
jgi:hypothetical protein